MEPNEQKDDIRKDAEDLHNEGIDIVGSSMALDNEYSQPEVHNVRSSNVEEEGGAENSESIEEARPTPQATPETQPETQPATQPDIQTPSTSQPAQYSRVSPVPPTASVPKPLETTPSQPSSTAQPVSPAQPPVQNDPSIKPIRTFKTDAEEAVRGGNLSKINIAVAAEKKREAQSGTPAVDNSKKASPGLYIALVVAAIILLCGSWYLWFASTAETSATNAPKAAVTIKTPIPYAKAGIVTVGNGTDQTIDPLALVAAKLSGANPGLGNVYIVVPLATATSTAIVPRTVLFGATHMPDRLVRSLSDDYMIGTYAYDVSGPFIIVRNTFYQNAFAGMLDWEKDMSADLWPLEKIAHPNDTAAPSGSFTDAVVSNIDTRELRDSSGDVVLAYAFPDQNTIVIATTENTLKYLLDKLLQVRTIQ